MVDLRGLTFLDCSGMRGLLSARRTFELHARPFAFYGTPQPVELIFSLTGNRALLDSPAGRTLFDAFTHGAPATLVLA